MVNYADNFVILSVNKGQGAYEAMKQMVRKQRLERKSQAEQDAPDFLFCGYFHDLRFLADATEAHFQITSFLILNRERLSDVV